MQWAVQLQVHDIEHSAEQLAARSGNCMRVG